MQPLTRRHGAAQFAGGAIHTRRRGRLALGRCRREPALRAVAVDEVTAAAQELGVSFAPIHEDLGADVLGIDLSGGISDAEGDLVKKALDRFLLLRFRQQTLEPADEAKLMSYLPHAKGIDEGEINTVFETSIPGYPWLAVMSANMDLKDYYGIDKEQGPRETSFFRDRPIWHMDLSQQQCSAKYSYMYMKVVPSEAPSTSFVSTKKAYSLLTKEQKKVANKLQVRNYSLASIFKLFAQEDANTIVTKSGIRYSDPVAVEDIVRQDMAPDEPFLMDHTVPFVTQEEGTGVRSIHASPYKIHSFDGMSTKESHELMEEFLEPVMSERVWNADWQPGDVVVWKNRQVIHAAPMSKTYNGPRLFHLVFWESDELVQPIQEE